MATPHDLPALRDVELSAATRFAGEDFYESVRGNTCDSTVLVAACEAGRLFVADHRGPVGFALLLRGPNNAHLYELSVAAEHQGRGAGSALLNAAIAWSREDQAKELTLTTFADLPWNAPFYAKRGFRSLPENQLSDFLRQCLTEEAAAGLPVHRRIAMALALPA